MGHLKDSGLPQNGFRAVIRGELRVTTPFRQKKASTNINTIAYIEKQF